MSQQLVLITIILSLLSIIKLIIPYCLADDCIRHLGYVNGMFTPELLPLGIFSFGIWTIKLLQIALPVIFSIGLYMLLKHKVDDNVLLIGILLANISLSFNLFWMILLKNGMVIAFSPFFLYFYQEKKYYRSLFFMVLMALSHMTFIILAIPIILHSIRKYLNYGDNNERLKIHIFFIIYVIVLLTVALPYYYMNQGSIVSKSGMTNLNYLFLDIPLIFFAILSKNNVFKLILVTTIIASGIALEFLVESWRIFLLINIPALLCAMFCLNDRWKNLDMFAYIYVAVALVLFGVFIINLSSYII